jgi:type I restriction enzyme S subunit
MNTPDLVGASALVESDAENLYLPDRLWQTVSLSLIPEFVASFMMIDGFRTQISLAAEGASSSMQNIAKDDYLAIHITHPASRHEQEKIAAFLDHETAKIDALIEKQQRLIELLKEKRQAVISHAVTKGLNPKAPMKDSGVEWLGEVPAHWVVCRLKQAIKSGSSISYGIVQPGEPLDDGIPFVQTTNMSKGTFDIDDLQKTTEEIANSYPRSKLVGGEVILGIRASIGAAFVVPEKLKGANLSRGVARIIPNENLRSEYLVLFFGTGSVSRYWDLSKQGSTFSEVSIETVREISLLIPPKFEQVEIDSFVKIKLSKIDGILDKAERKTALLKERRTALISAAVTGKIDVRDWQAAA